VQYFDKVGLEALEGGRFGYGQGGIEFYNAAAAAGSGSVSNNSEEGGKEGSYLLYWVLDVSQQGYYSKVICVEHEDDPKSEQIVVRWVATLSGILNGMPKIGSDGKFIYLTINTDTNTPISVNTNDFTNDSTATSDGSEGEGVSPSDEPPASTSSNTTGDPIPTPYWFFNVGEDDDNNSSSIIICDYGTEFPEQVSVNGTTSVNVTLFETRDECCAAQPSACSEEPPVVVVGSDNDGNTTANNETMVTTTTTVGVGEPTEASSSSGAETEVPDGAPEGEATGSEQSGNRQLQTPKKSGRFIILNADTGNVVYSFDSRSDFTIRKHDFGPLGIARRPAYGNYAGGEGNTNDVVMWGSGSGNDDDGVGETLLFQLPKGFDTTSLASSASLANQFETRVMESVPWTTEIAPTFSKDGLSVYFLISGYRLTGWNKGQAFDIAPNVGPVDVVSTANPATGGIQRPMVLTNDDKTLLVGAQDTMYGVDVSNTPASILWQQDTFGPGAAFTTPQITPDGSMAYFGKTGALHAVNLNTEGTLLWADTNGYVDPFTSASQVTMADFSLDASGQILYYCHGGSDTITALRIGEVVPTEAPTFKPSAAPSVTASMSPSTSMVPTLSMIPTHGSDYIFPSVSPSVIVSDAPSTLPSVKPTVSPTESSYPTTMIMEGGGDEDVFTFDVSTPTPTASTAENNTATTATNGEGSTVAIKEDENSSSFPLSMTAIIGIAVAGGVGLILLLASLCYVCRKKPCCKGGSSEDDGVDTDWQSTNEETNRQMQFSSSGGGGGGGDNQTPFQYGDEESDVYGGGPLKW